ncbi:MAG: GIY-YIG nuclease family protein [Hyphomicrobiaceae bacterium]
MTFSVYIVRCADASLYTGVATDVARRIAEHNGITPTGTKSKRGARYTAARRPVELVYTAILETRSLAQKEEARLKRLPRSEKMALIRSVQSNHTHDQAHSSPVVDQGPNP